MSERKNVLRFGENGTFKILMISDFHGGPKYNPKLKTGIEALISYANPNLVLIGGDQVSCKCFDEVNEHELYSYLEDALSPINCRGIPWAHVFGNHDREMGMSNERQQAVYEAFPLCLSSAGPEEVYGVGNYCLNVLSSHDDSVAYNIWALDSNREICDYAEKFSLAEDEKILLSNGFGDSKTQASPMFDQVMWYYTESLKYEKASGRKIPAIMWMHVPIIEFCLVYRNPKECKMVGTKREDICCSELNSGLFMACLQRGDVKGIFCGHEHLNDFKGEYCGITLAYDSCIGYDMYAHDDLRGGRVIELHEGGGFDTYHIKLMALLSKAAFRNQDVYEGIII